MSISRVSNWFKDPITLLGFMNLFTMMQLTLYMGYLSIFLTEDLIVSIFIFTVIVTSINIFQIFMRVPLAGFSQVVGRKPMILFGNLFYSVVVCSISNCRSLFSCFLLFYFSRYWYECSLASDLCLYSGCFS